jgi:hypothetical protein
MYLSWYNIRNIAEVYLWTLKKSLHFCIVIFSFCFLWWGWRVRHPTMHVYGARFIRKTGMLIFNYRYYKLAFSYAPVRDWLSQRETFFMGVTQCTSQLKPFPLSKTITLYFSCNVLLNPGIAPSWRPGFQLA